MDGTQPTVVAWSRIAGWIMASYAWIATVSFGSALIDSMYARTLSDSTSVAAVARAFNEVSDFQNLPLAVGVLAGIAALVMASDRPLVRNLLIASLACTLAPIPIVMLLGDLIEDAGAGPGLRLTLAAGASLLAMGSLSPLPTDRRRDGGTRVASSPATDSARAVDSSKFEGKRRVRMGTLSV